MAQIGANVPLAAKAAEDVPGTAAATAIDVLLIDHCIVRYMLYLQEYGRKAQTAMT